MTFASIRHRLDEAELEIDKRSPRRVQHYLSKYPSYFQTHWGLHKVVAKLSLRSGDIESCTRFGCRSRLDLLNASKVLVHRCLRSFRLLPIV